MSGKLEEGLTLPDLATEFRTTEQQRELISFIDPFADTYYLMIERHHYRGSVDLDILQSALGRVLDRHAVLRSVQDIKAGVYRVVGTGADLVGRIWVYRAGFSDAGAAVEAAQGDVGGPMDVTKELPLRVWAGSLNNGETVIVVAGHHLVFDAWTFMLFYEDLAAEYARATSGSLAEQEHRRLPPQYGEIEDNPSDEALEGWEDVLSRSYSAIRDLQASVTTPRGPGAEKKRTWPALTKDVLTAARRYRVTPYVLGATAMLRAISNLLGDDEVILGSAYAGRTTSDATEVLGYFSTSLFIGLDLSDGEGEAATEIKSVASQLRRWHSSPRIQWEELLGRYRGMDLYPFKFAFQPSELSQRRMVLPGAEVTPLSRGTGSTSAKRVLDLICSYDGSGVHASMKYRTDALTHDQAELLLDGFGRHLEIVASQARH